MKIPLRMRDFVNITLNKSGRELKNNSSKFSTIYIDESHLKIAKPEIV